ncbi:cytochrome P450 [Nocardia sp. NPDC056100]|uniref:cytochrome P450 n=1 Tax=Nocardia sp. NPDC056100 TaxID=3345712 RepID=UPI0035D71029
MTLSDPPLSEVPSPGCPVAGMSATRTPTGDPAWLATGYHLVRELFAEPNLGRSHPSPETASRMGESAFFGGPVGNFASERADHLRMKSILQPHFSVRRMREFQPRVEAITARLLDEMAAQGSSADLHTALALPLPLLVICELLGVPYDDRDRFREWVTAVGDVRDRAKVEWGVAELFEYCRKSVERKRRDPGDDVTSRLCADPELSEEEIATFAMMLLFAGHETSVVHIGVGALMLLADPELWRTLHDNPALLPSATEELLRACEPTNLPRYARTDLDIDGVRVAAGDLVLLGLTSANHDPTVFPEPSRVDFTRQQGTHFTFGYGARYCIGAPLARIELHTAFGQLVSRFPDMRLAVDKQTLIMRDDVFTGGLRTLPVRW